MHHMIQMWKIPVSSKRANTAPPQVIREYCFNNTLIGIGWEIPGLAPTMNPADYAKLLTQATDMPKRGRAFKAFSESMKIGDLIWCREASSTYRLGKVTGDWEYKPDGVFKDYDLFQVRKCAWTPSIVAHDVPGAVTNNFAGPMPTISRIHSNFAKLASIDIWNRIYLEDQIANNKLNKQFSLNDLGHVEMEDIVLLYLQLEHKWAIVPSTKMKSTPGTECVLINKHGQRAHVQVKSGKFQASEPEYLTNIDEFFLFDPTSDPRQENKWTTKRIAQEDIIQFIKANKNILPKYLEGYEIK